jgi:hypothetical protein
MLMKDCARRAVGDYEGFASVWGRLRRSEKAAVFGTFGRFFGSSLERKPEDPKKRHRPSGHPVGFRIIARP